MADGPTDVNSRAVRSWLLLWVPLWSLVLSAAYADEVSVVEASDLSADARLVVSRRIPLLLLITREDCGYCELLKRAVIIPMILSGEYEDRVIIREISIDRPTTLVDFSGREVSPFAVADRYDAFLTRPCYWSTLAEQSWMTGCWGSVTRICTFFISTRRSGGRQNVSTTGLTHPMPGHSTKVGKSTYRIFSRKPLTSASYKLVMLHPMRVSRCPGDDCGCGSGFY